MISVKTVWGSARISTKMHSWGWWNDYIKKNKVYLLTLHVQKKKLEECAWMLIIIPRKGGIGRIKREVNKTFSRTINCDSNKNTKNVLEKVRKTRNQDNTCVNIKNSI